MLRINYAMKQSRRMGLLRVDPVLSPSTGLRTGLSVEAQVSLIGPLKNRLCRNDPHNGFPFLIDRVGKPCLSWVLFAGFCVSPTDSMVR